MLASLPAAAVQLVHSFFDEQQDARRREAEARVMVSSRIIVTWVGWVTLDYEAEAYERPSAYLLIMTGAGAGGGVGLEAQETRPATARARIAYFIVCIVVFVFALIVAVIARENS